MKKKVSKRYKKLLSISKDKKVESIDTAIKKIKSNCTTKFNESIDVSFNLNLKTKPLAQFSAYDLCVDETLNLSNNSIGSIFLYI